MTDNDSRNCREKNAVVTQLTEAKDTVQIETTEVRQDTTEQTAQAEDKVEAVKEKKGFFFWFKKKAA